MKIRDPFRYISKGQIQYGLQAFRDQSRSNLLTPFGDRLYDMGWPLRYAEGYSC